MEIDEFIERVAGEVPRIITRNVRPTFPHALAEGKPGGIPLSELMSGPVPLKHQTIRYGHILGAPASPGVIERWEKCHPTHPLPSDLKELVGRVNGIHLWANSETGRAYIGLAPIEEWEIARIKMYGSTANTDVLDDRFIALTYHQDGAAFVVLDTNSGTYFLMDTAGPDESAPIAGTAAQLLEWLWARRIEPK